MRKLWEDKPAAPTPINKSKAGFIKFIKICGYILFTLGIATLFSVIYYYRLYTQVPLQAAIVASAEIAAGFMQIKCVKQFEFQKLSLIFDIAAVGILTIILYLYPDMLRLPAFIGLTALAACIVISLLRIIKFKK